MRHNVFLLVLLLVVGGVACPGQEGVRVLFVGNSYTEVNSLPQMVLQVAESMGETVEWQSNTPGGCPFRQHCSNRSMELVR